ncbi:uncharacterized protein STEHIDRAFT_153492 [Stereum hirsutum FP-91666 SS1]|uniref:uncharacterized protein n=1 Tax=Stereum hirsutum (strain FP-91666) TaxID=721885 RepID=UPI000440DF91|nr:uncharacterized protein STEHIDRAFT_153492 [Stereum hirsutum FP-91666 SS1]EIM89648.1 hypothetical protein STEHIDRAFT_153492 [Stereum hirsutum FP-91666 SS1]
MLRNAVSRFILLPTRQTVPASASWSSSFFLTGTRLVSTHATAPSNEIYPSATSTSTSTPPFDPSSSANPVTGTVTSSLNATDSDSKGRGTRREKVFRPKRVKCFLCNQRGHVAKFCPTAAEVVAATAGGEVEGQGEGAGEGKEVAEVPEEVT